MKVNIIQGPFLPLPPGKSGAVERRWYYLSREFARQGIEVCHYSKAYGRQDSSPGNNLQHSLVAGFNRPRSQSAMILLDLIYALRVRSNWKQADIAITHTFWMPLFLPKKCIKCVHVARAPRGQMSLYKGCDRIQAVSTDIAARIIREVPNLKDRVKVFPNALPDSWLQSPDSMPDVRRREFVFLGRIHPEKGLGLLLRGWSLFQEREHWALRIIGPSETSLGGGGYAYLQTLQKTAKDLGIEGSVQFEQALHSEYEVKNVLDEAYGLIYPTLEDSGESFGMAPLEAMARGCIPIVSHLPCFNEYLVENVNGFVFNSAVAGADKGLSEALVRATSMDAKAMRLEGVQTGHKHSTTSAVVKYIDDFSSLCSR